MPRANNERKVRAQFSFKLAPPLQQATTQSIRARGITPHTYPLCLPVCEESTQGQGTKNGPNCVALGAGNIKRGAHDQRQSSLGAAICFRMINFPMCAQQFDPFLRPCANNDKEFSPPAPHTSGGGWHGVSITCVCHWRLHSSANNTTWWILRE
jgi:hypothetical protein